MSARLSSHLFQLVDLLEFLEECTTTGDSFTNVATVSLFDCFTLWCRGRGINEGTIRVFIKAMGYAGHQVTRLDLGARGFRGLYVSAPPQALDAELSKGPPPAEEAVTQPDRDAVQAFHREMAARLMADIKHGTTNLGKDEGDAGSLVQAFARHRLAAIHEKQPGGELQSYQKFDGTGLHAETIETRASIGERFLECYESALDDPLLKGYTPADCPSEIVLDMLERLRDATAPKSELREALINTPETADFMAGVPLEATHQRDRWGSQQDAGKSPFDWFWLIGYLAQKAADAAVRGDSKKAMHHTISTAAALANWHCALSGIDTSMRPGIAERALEPSKANGGENGL